MVYAEYYHDSTGWNGKDFSGPKTLIPMVASDSIFHLDGRKNLHNQIADAKENARKKNRSLKLGIKGLRITQGDRYTTAKPITKDIILLEG